MKKSLKPVTIPIEFICIDEIDDSKNELQTQRNAYILKIVIEKTIEVNDHYEFILRILGRSRFCNYLPEPTSYISYICRARYKTLLKLHNSLENYLETKILYKYKEPLKMPEFPGKKWFGSDKKIAEERVKLLNKYFEQLFLNYGPTVTFCEPILDFFAPFKFDILIVSQETEMRDRFLNSLIMALYNNFEAKISQKISDSISSTTSSTLLISEIQNKSGVLKSVPAIIELLKNTKCKSTLWKKYFPIDYVSNEHFFRLDIINAYFSSKISYEKLLGNTACIILIIDLLEKDCWKKLKEMLVIIAEKDKNSTSQKLQSVLGIGINEEFRSKSSNPEIIEKCANSILGPKCVFIYAECSIITGEGVLDSLNSLLKLYN